MMQKFNDLFFSNFQPEPRIVNDTLIWGDKDKHVCVNFTGKDADVLYTSNFNMLGSFKFDGAAESVPVELMDEIFEVNGFTGDKQNVA